MVEAAQALAQGDAGFPVFRQAKGDLDLGVGHPLLLANGRIEDLGLDHGQDGLDVEVVGLPGYNPLDQEPPARTADELLGGRHPAQAQGLGMGTPGDHVIQELIGQIEVGERRQHGLELGLRERRGIHDHRGEDPGIRVARLPEPHGEGVIDLDRLGQGTQVAHLDPELIVAGALPRVDRAHLLRAPGLELGVDLVEAVLHRFRHDPS
ncbi:hypothetical protein D3C87_1193540 [compost metagenome]